MSGLSGRDDAAEAAGPARAGERRVLLEPGRRTTVGDLPVRRVLPRRGRRTVGSWCFADHMGPLSVSDRRGADIAPHPHLGLQTVTWLVAGEVVHRDSLGTVQAVRPGQLNLMTAGYGVAHAEESPPPSALVARSPALGGPARGHPPRGGGLRAPPGAP